MYKPERFLKYNTTKIRSNCESPEVADKVIGELKEIKVALESQFLDEAKKIFKKYNVNTKGVTFITESYHIEDIELYDEWLHKSIS